MTGIAGGYSTDGKTKWQSAAFFAYVASQTKFTAVTVNRLLSMAKPINAIAIMQVVEK